MPVSQPSQAGPMPAREPWIAPGNHHGFIRATGCPFVAGGAEGAIIKDLAIIMIASAVAAVTVFRFRQPVVLGYIVAGFLVGPFTPIPAFLDAVGLGPVGTLPFVVQNPAFVESFRDLGLILLLFAIGLEFNVGRLRTIGAIPVVAATLEMTLMFGAGFSLAQLLGWGFVDALFLGAMLAISSTAIIFKLLMASKELRAKHGLMITGILLIEDVAAILFLTLLPSIALTGNFQFEAFTVVLLKTGIFVVAGLVLGLLIIPRIVRRVSDLGVDELLVLTLLGLAFGFAILADSLGFSLALGAFIAGAIVGDAPNAHFLGERVAPVRDMFTAVFFVAVGMLLVPGLLIQHWMPILIITAVVIVGKFVAVFFASFVAGQAPETSVKVALGLAMIGEFSIILATVGASLPTGVATSEFLFPVIVSVAAITSFITPNLIRRSAAVTHLLAKAAPETVRTYANIYRGWTGRIASGGTGDPAAREMRVFAVHVAVYTILLVAVVASASILDGEITTMIGGQPTVAFLVVWVGAAFFALPVLFALVNDLRRLIDALVERAIPSRIRTARQAANAAKVLKRTFWLAGAVVVVAFLFSVTAPFLPPLNLLLLAGAIVGLATVFLYGAMRDLEHEVHGAVRRVFTGGETDERGGVMAAISKRAPTRVNWGQVAIEGESMAAHRPIRDLNVRESTGASVIAVDRHGSRIVNPDPSEVVLPGDSLVLMGEPPEVEAARTLLSTPQARPKRVKRQEMALEEVRVEEGSDVSGRTLREGNLRNETGASVVSIRREGRTITNPGAAETLHAGDDVLLLGDREQVSRAKERFSGNQD